MEIFGYLCAILVGISLGILGSGGSILTVPIMVYLMNISPADATAYSLFVVGFTSCIGGISYIKKRLVDIRTALIFAVPSILFVFITRRFLIPLIPDSIIFGKSVAISKDLFILFLFAILMIAVAYNMIRDAGYHEAPLSEVHQYNYAGLILIGSASGLLTGLLGVGGGFIIIPALVLFAKIPVRMSVGTSLLIIAFNSLSGFSEEMLLRNTKIDYSFLLCFSLLSAAGIFIGFQLALKLKPTQLKRTFGWFIMLMGIAVLINVVFFRIK